jgi:hypothetical protein
MDKMPDKTVVTEKGIEFQVTGNYPDGPYVKTIKNRGPKDEEPTEIDVETISETDFRRLVLNALGIPVKGV